MPADMATIQVPKRAYQACLRCRGRKSRCILSEPTEGSELICLRCKRERKTCVFTTERSEKSTRPSLGDNTLDQQSNQTVGLSASPRLTARTRRSGVSILSNKTSSPATTQGENAAGQSDHLIDQLQNNSPGTHLTDRVTHTVVRNQVDALNLLFEAAEVYHTNDGAAGSTSNNIGEIGDSRDVPDVLSALDGNSTHSPEDQATNRWHVSAYTIKEPTKTALEIFSGLKFVQKRWLTAQSAISYVELFFKHMNPLSPVVDDSYGNPVNYPALVKDEPVLCTVILTLSSRYHFLTGDGWLSRGYFLHNRLWRYCQSLLQRVIWGQETGAISPTRGLGTVEGLLLMVEWHTRSLHLPPDIEAWDSDDGNEAQRGTAANGVSQIPNRWLEGVLEPMRRSDRMSWTLIQSAVSLAQELDLFDEDQDQFHDGDELALHRRRRLRVLLYVYINQLAFRIGFSSLIPHNLLSISPTAILKLYPSGRIDDKWSNLLSLMVDLTRLVRTSSDLLFPSKAALRDLVRNGGYRRLLEHFRPMLESWWNKYNALSAPEPQKDLLSIDFMYTKIYIYSLALQAVAERKISYKFTEGVANEFISSILDLNYGDYEFIREVIDSAKAVLGTIHSFAGTGRLKFLPVRIYVRVISACIFLLKALALGVRMDELNTSLDLIDQSARLLRSDVVDDLHLAGVFASLLETYTKRFRERFTNIARITGTGPNSALSEAGCFPTDMQVDVQIDPNQGAHPVNEFVISQDWLTYPFDSSIAPFGVGVTQGFAGFADDELNFIWNSNV